MAHIYRLLVLIGFLQLARGKLKDRPPLRLCCDVDYYYDAAQYACTPSNQTLLADFVHLDGSATEEGFFIPNVTGMNACNSYNLQKTEFSLLTDGSIIVGSEDTSKIYTVQPDKYCLLWMKSNENYAFSSLICFPEKSSPTSNNFYNVTHGIILPIAMAISAFFLVATFVIYCLVPELRDQLGKSFMCSVACLTLSKILAIIIKTSSSQLPIWLCVLSGMAMHVCFLQAFFWLNVISILVFTSLWCRRLKFCFDAKGGFISSCIYAFGIPAAILLVVIIHDFSTVLDNSPIPTPGFGVGSCWFSNRGAQIVYFYAPIATLVAINFTLFCMSACKLFTLSSSTSSFHFKQYLKLFLLMGISWTFEVLSFFFGTPSVPSVSSYIWFILDLFNALCGFFIFIFFACKRTLLSRAVARIRGTEAYDSRLATSFHAEEISKNDSSSIQDVKLVRSAARPKQMLEA